MDAERGLATEIKVKRKQKRKREKCMNDKIKECEVTLVEMNPKDKTNKGFKDEQRIVEISGVGWECKVVDAVFDIENKLVNYYTMVDGERAEVEVVTPKFGLPYLRTNKDESDENNLLSLPSEKSS